MLGKWIVALSSIALVCVLAACMPVAVDPDQLYQSSTYTKLNTGDFDGDLTIGTLKTHGDFGLGTFNALDGEMVMLDGVVYQVHDDGVPVVAKDGEQTPYAAVTYFGADQTIAISDTLDCTQLQTQIDSRLPTLDQPYAIKVSGEFVSIKLRAPHKQSRPYPALTDALKDQVVFESQNISGTIVGYRLPDYLQGVNTAGYHFHFISDDKQHGGHVLGCETAAVTVQVDETDHLSLDVTPYAEK
jgi:acetolactate decarboxylase